MDKVNFINCQQPALNAYNLMKMQDNIERAINAQVSGDTLPIGTVLPFSGINIPENWLLCDGREISRDEYNQLFYIIDTTYGEGDGSTTFNLPDLRGKVPVGIDATDEDFNSLGKTVGEKNHALTVEEMPSQESTGEDKSNNNVQPSIVLNYIIKARQTVGIVGQIIDGPSESSVDGYSANYLNNYLKDITIVESGSNKNGDYVKYGNGRMICTKTAVVSLNLTSAVGSLYTASSAQPTGEWAQPFIEKPIVDVSHVNSGGYCWISFYEGVSATSSGNINVMRASSFNNFTGRFDMVAFGRWKEGEKVEA